MKRWAQYGSLLGLLAVFFAAGLWGFTATGGSVPWAKRSATTLQRGIQEGGGALVDLGRGIVVAGPIRNGGLIGEFLAVTVLFALVGAGLYVYADRYRGLDDANRTGR
jgi:hypothetical protein